MHSWVLNLVINSTSAWLDRILNSSIFFAKSPNFHYTVHNSNNLHQKMILNAVSYLAEISSEYNASHPIIKRLNKPATCSQLTSSSFCVLKYRSYSYEMRVIITILNSDLHNQGDDMIQSWACFWTRQCKKFLLIFFLTSELK